MEDAITFTDGTRDEGEVLLMNVCLIMDRHVKKEQKEREIVQHSWPPSKDFLYRRILRKMSRRYYNYIDDAW
jgi:hypothetical protein